VTIVIIAARAAPTSGLMESPRYRQSHLRFIGRRDRKGRSPPSGRK
jgi:hypothetical protein